MNTLAKSSRILMLAVALLVLTFQACTPEEVMPDPDPDPDPIEEAGILYVYGNQTVADAPGVRAGKMNLAALDPGKGLEIDSTENIYGKLIYIGAGGDIELAWETESGTTNYGVEGMAGLDSASAVGGALNALVFNGDLVEGGNPVSVENEGLYYLYVDMDRKTFIMMEVQFNIIGDATDQEWAAGTPFVMTSTTAEKTVFEIAEIELKADAGYRYRYGDGWHIFAGTNIITMTSLGVPSYGEAYASGVNEIGYYLDNIPSVKAGSYSIKLTYDAATETWTEEKTEIVAGLDFSETQYGWFGNAYYVSGTVEGAWDDVHLTKIPNVDGQVFTWEWTQELIEGRSFVLRGEEDFATWIVWNTLTQTGKAFEENNIVKEADQDNFQVATGGAYIIKLIINTADNTRSLDIQPE